MNEQGAMQAVSMREEFSKLADYSSATRLPDQTITRGRNEFPCYLESVTTAQRKGPKTAGFSSAETLWIDKVTWAVRKTLVSTRSRSPMHLEAFIYHLWKTR